MNTLLLGNAICFCASIVMTLIGFIKEKRRYLLAQSVMNLLFIAGNLTLGGVAGGISNAVTMLRNLIGARRDLNRPLKLGFIALQIALSLIFRVSGFIAWLPVIGTCLFTWFMDSENMVFLKALVIVTQALWGLYDWSILNYATVPFDIAATVTNAVSVISLLRDRKKAAEVR